MARTGGLTRLQCALLIGTPIAITAGYAYYRYRRSRNAITEDENASSVESSQDQAVDPINEAMTKKNKGNKYFKAGKYSEAIKCYSEAISLCPELNKTELATFYQNRAAAYENLRDYAKVIEDTTKAYELNPKYTKALYRRAKAYEHLKQYELSLEDVTIVCILEGFQNQPALMMTDRVLKQLGQVHAKEAFKNHVPYLPSNHFISNYFVSYHLDPFAGDSQKYEDGMTGYLKAIHDFRKEQYTNVIDDCDDEISKESEFKSKALLLRATFYLLRSEMSKAKTDLDQLISTVGISKQVHCNALIKLASLKVQEGLDDCIDDFNTAIKLDPENPDAYLHRGQIFLLMNKVDNSIEDMNKAVEIAPDFAIAHVQLIYMKYRKASQGNNMTELASILKQFEQLAVDFPNCSEAFFLHAQVLAEQQKFDEALKLYDAALKIDLTNPNIYIHKGILYLQWKNDVEQAVKLINKSIEVDDKCEFAYETLGSIEVQRGNMVKAIELFEKAILLAKSESEMVHLFSLKDAAQVQLKMARKLGINIPVLPS